MAGEPALLGVKPPQGWYAIAFPGHFPYPGYYLVSGESPRGDFKHLVVYCAGELVHDPHPSGDGLRGVSDDDQPNVSANRHCPDCEVAWAGRWTPCWSCGGPGSTGAYLYGKVTVTPAQQFRENQRAGERMRARLRELVRG